MKQWLKRGVAAVLVLGLVTIGAGAVGVGPGTGGRNGRFCSTQSCRCVNDGVCDRLGRGMGFVDADGDGICDKLAQGIGFVDANGDGVCDHRTGGGTGWRGGRGK